MQGEGAGAAPSSANMQWPLRTAMQDPCSLTGLPTHLPLLSAAARPLGPGKREWGREAPRS